MNPLSYLGLFAAFAVFSGCCGTASTPSSSCPYGTYGETCSAVCSQPGMGGNCVSDCMDSVRSYGLGDATTCCKETFRQNCDRTCTELERSTQGDTTKAECMDECTSTVSSAGLPLDACYLPFA